MKSLDQILTYYGSDKATSHPVVRDGKGHGYAPVYDHFFTPLREQPVKFLEIGVGSGCSVQSWLEYFSHEDAQVFGVDVIQKTNPWNTVVDSIPDKPSPRYTFVTGDQSDDTFWACFKVDYGSGWDVICDDGSHISSHIISTFNHLWPVMKPGGLYCIEDLCCSYGAASGFCPDGSPTHMQFISGLLDKINLENDIESLHFSKELVIIKKK